MTLDELAGFLAGAEGAGPVAPKQVSHVSCSSTTASGENVSAPLARFDSVTDSSNAIFGFARVQGTGKAVVMTLVSYPLN